MSNLRTISQEDLDTYPSLRGKKVGDTITAEEDAKLRAEDKEVPLDVEPMVQPKSKKKK